MNKIWKYNIYILYYSSHKNVITNITHKNKKIKRNLTKTINCYKKYMHLSIEKKLFSIYNTSCKIELRNLLFRKENQNEDE